jgi:predicted lipoprotein with Yx(FWY)xxD motif
MNRARPVAALSLTLAALALVAACGTNPYATSSTVPALGAQQQPASAVPAGSVGSVGSVAGQAQLTVSTVEGLGAVLADAGGHTLYRYAKDTAKPPKSACAGACAETWPPLLSDVPVTAAGADGRLVGSVVRPDGRKQVTVAGWPVYTYAEDTGPGVALGRNVSADWAAITPTGKKAAGDPATDPAAADPTVGTTDIGGLGSVLTDSAGRTLYLFTKDGRGAGKSTCDGACAQKWPPVPADGRITAAGGIDAGLLGRIRRADGSSQLTVGGWPAYTYAQDGAPGEANGHGAGNTWYAVEPNGCKVDPARRPDARQAITASSVTSGY